MGLNVCHLSSMLFKGTVDPKPIIQSALTELLDSSEHATSLIKPLKTNFYL